MIQPYVYDFILGKAKLWQVLKQNVTEYGLIGLNLGNHEI